MKKDSTEVLIRCEPIDTFELELRIRNNAIKQRREMLNLTQDQLAEQTGISKATLTTYETLRKSPRGSDGQWRSTALRLAAFFQVTPEVLWPEVTQFITQPVIRRKADQHEVETLYAVELERARERQQLTDPEMHVALVEQRARVQEAFAQLTPREQTIVNLRFGFDGAPMTLAEVGKVLGVERTRVQQLEAKILRKLRHPSRSRKLLDASLRTPPLDLVGCAQRFFVDQLKTCGLTPVSSVVVHGPSRWEVFSGRAACKVHCCVSCDDGTDASMGLHVLANQRVVVLTPLAFVPTPQKNEEEKETEVFSPPRMVLWGEGEVEDEAEALGDTSAYEWSLLED